MNGKTDTLRRVRSRDFDAIEDEWLERLDSDPTDTEYFVEVAQALADTEQIEAARPLLRLLDEELGERGAVHERLQFLLAAGRLFLRPAALHEAVVESLRQIYGASDSFPAMLRIAGLHQSPAEPRNLERQVERFHALMLLDVGSLVSMEGKGVGTITEINFDLGRYKVDFERHPALTIGFKAGAKLLQPIPTHHILRDKIESPRRLEALRDERPSELLREVLESFPEPLGASQIKAALEGIVSAEQWSSWWNAARQHPQVLVTADKGHRYHWAGSSDDAAEALRGAFEQADIGGQLEIFSKNARQNPELAEALAVPLAAAARRRRSDDPALALEVWYALSRADLADDSADFAPAAIVESAGDIAALVAGLARRALRESVYGEVRRQRDDWLEVLSRCVLSEPDVGLVALLMEQIGERDPERREALLDRALGRPQEHPAAFVWLAQRAGEDEALRRSRALRLFRQLVTVQRAGPLAPYRSAWTPLLESGGTLPKLVADLADEDADPALAAVKRAPLEEYLRGPLIAALEMRFAALREEVDQGLYALADSIAARREEARRLHEEEIPANRRAIQEAAALGDLRENFEYKSARQRHEYLSARLAALQGELACVRPIDLDGLRVDEVRIGCRVDLTSGDEARTITILGPWESDPDAGVLSYQSELGRLLLGARPGDTVEIEGRSFDVAAIRPFDPTA